MTMPRWHQRFELLAIGAIAAFLATTPLDWFRRLQDGPDVYVTAWHIPYMEISIPKVGVSLLVLLVAGHVLRRRPHRRSVSFAVAIVALAACWLFVWLIVGTYFHALDPDPDYYRLKGARLGVACAVIAAIAETGAFTATRRTRRPSPNARRAGCQRP